jgi:hypothetical protein
VGKEKGLIAFPFLSVRPFLQISGTYGVFCNVLYTHRWLLMKLLCPLGHSVFKKKKKLGVMLDGSSNKVPFMEKISITFPVNLIKVGVYFHGIQYVLYYAIMARSYLQQTKKAASTYQPILAPS